MSEYMVEVGLQANVDQYVTGMGQAIALTKQYTQVADGVNGKVADLNSGIVGLTNKVTGFNKVNTVALDTAAAYQKQLSKVEATAKITGQNFEKLATTTKGWARSFPIGMGEATKVMETLQMQGIKSERQMESLGKSFIKLGAATGTSASGMGAEFLQLSRTMGNGIGQFEKLSDSLVSTTAKIGGSAPAVVAFSKALAPVAATVGLSQTAVIGLSTAMSKLGEDGYQAANSFNKVLLDMNRSIRDGGPELKAYADLMGTTTTQLKEMFKVNPAEVLARFSEAVAKEGPNISRTLDALGFDSVRTTRSLTALARSGGPREAIQTAVESYGSGSTEMAAAAALDGVNDQAVKLQETMSQVVQNVGQPLLGVAKTQLQIANQVSGLIASATESGPGQALLGAGGAAGMVGGLASNVMMAGGILALGRLGMSGIRNSRFMAGARTGRGYAMDGMGPMYMPAMTPSERVGYAMGTFRQGLMPGGGADGTAPGAAGALARASNRMASWGLQAAVKTNESLNTGFVKRAMGQEPYSTPTGQAVLASSKAAATSVAGLATGSSSLDEAKEATKQARNDLRAMNREMASRGIGRGIGDVARSVGGSVATNAAMVGSTALRAGSGIAGGMSALGLTGPTAIMMGGMVGGMYMAQKKGEGDEAMAKIDAASQDIYTSFNNFAEASGMAGKGLVSFQAQVEKSTITLTDQNTSMEKALQLSTEEISQATSPSYQTAFKLIGDDKSAASIAAQAQTMLGDRARPQEVSRVLMDVVNQTNVSTAEEVAGILKGGLKQGAEIDYKSLIGSLDVNKNLLLNTVNDAQAGIGVQISTAAQRKAYEASQTFGGTITAGGRDIGVSQAVALAEAQKVFDATRTTDFGMADDAEIQVASKALQNILGLSDSQAIDTGLGADFKTLATSSNALQQGVTFDQYVASAMSKLGDEAPEALKNFAALQGQGFNFKDIKYSQFASEAPGNEVESRKLEESFNRVTGASSKLTESLYGAEKAARSFGTTTTDLTGVQRTGLSQASQALLDFEKNPSDDRRLRAAQGFASQAGRDSQNPTQAAFALALASAQAPEGYKKDALTAAQQLQSRSMGEYYSGGRAGQQSLDVMRQGYAAQMMPATSSATYNTAIQSQISMGVQATTGMNNDIANLIKQAGAMRAQIGSINRSSGIAAGAVARDARLNEQYATEDYQLQRQYSQQDYRRQRRIAQRDYGISRDRAVDSFSRQQGYQLADFNKSRARAEEDFNRQMTQMREDYDKGVLRANADFNTQKERANRDYNLQVSRANRDFNLSQTRAQEDFNLQSTRATADYNKGRLRMVEDFNKQVKRMVEDSTKSLMDPFKRMQVQMIMDAGQLVSNLREQQGAMEKQVANLAEARNMGLSEQAIQQLGLADAQNAQQLSRLVEDMRGNRDFTGQLNSAVSDRANAGAALVQDQGNVQFARMQEDFNTGLTRNEEDFNTSMARSTTDFETSKARALADFNTAMADAKTDFTTSMTDMQADFDKTMARGLEDYTTQVARSNLAFNTEMARGMEDYLTNLARSVREFGIQMSQMEEDFNRSMGDMEKSYKISMDRAEVAFEKSIERMRTRAANAISDIGAQAGAQIKSMQESFMGMFQQAPKDPVEAAKKAQEILLSMGIDKDLWGDELIRIWDGAQLILDNHMGRFRGKVDRDQSPPAAPVYDESMKLSMKEPKPIVIPVQIDYANAVLRWTAAMRGDIPLFIQTGADMWAGWQKGLKDARDAGEPEWKVLWNGVIESVKGFFGIASPSKVFMGIGENVVAGLAKGIKDTIGGVWEQITDPISKLDIDGKVTQAFKGTQTYLQGLGSTISGWISTGWDMLWDGLGKFDLGKKVEGAFKSAKDWLKDLRGDGPDSIKEWVGDAWSMIVSKIPTFTEVMDTVKSTAFGIVKGTPGEGIVKWLQGLKADDDKGDTVKAWVGKAWHMIINDVPGIKEVNAAFKGLGQSIYNIVGSLIDAWNRLKIEFSAPTWVGPENLKPSWWPSGTVGFGVKQITKPTPPEWMAAMGGIATKQMTTMIAEAGYPEAVIPLNQRGAEVLAATMARYVDNTSVKSAMVSPYSTHVVNNYNANTYDHRTQFNGEITVQAQDPDQMAKALQARARRQALAQPVRGRT